MGWFSKGGGDNPAPPMVQPTQDNTAMYMEMMGGMMEGLMGMAASQQASMSEMNLLMNAPKLPDMPSMPALTRDPIVDWTKKQSQLNQKAKADWNVGDARRKGRAGTVLTSPLLDEEEATTTGSILSGGAG